MPDPLDQFANDAIASASPPSENAIQAEEGKTRETERVTAGLTDRDGFPFDPDVHQTGSDGEPLTTKLGRLKRKPGRKPGQSGQSTLNVPGDAAGGEIDPEPRMVAIFTVDGVQSLGLMLGGDEWAYKKDDTLGIDERMHGIETFTNFYAVNGIKDIPPGLALAIWGLSYAAPRIFAGPKTKSRIKLAWEWTKIKFGRKKDAHADNRNDGERENNASGGIVREVSSAGLQGGGPGPVAR